MTDCSKLRVVFAGTPAFSVPALQALASSSHDVVAVYSQPDRRAGRGRKVSASAVKQAALDLGIPVLQPVSFADAADVEQLRVLSPDVMVVVAYGLLLPPAVLSVPALGCINIHGSLLPRWRGAAPIQRAILAGDQQTGITIMQMDKGLDTGPMLAWQSVDLTSTTTAASLHDELSILGASLLMDVLPSRCEGSIEAVKQDDALATYAAKLDKSEAVIDWTQSADSILRQICAFNPTPVAETRLNHQTLRIWQADKTTTRFTKEPGTVVRCNKSGLEVATGDGSIMIEKMQLPGKKIISQQDFVNGRDITGVVLGSREQS